MFSSGPFWIFLGGFSTGSVPLLPLVTLFWSLTYRFPLVATLLAHHSLVTLQLTYSTSYFKMTSWQLYWSLNSRTPRVSSLLAPFIFSLVTPYTGPLFFWFSLVAPLLAPYCYIFSCIPSAGPWLLYFLLWHLYWPLTFRFLLVAPLLAPYFYRFSLVCNHFLPSSSVIDFLLLPPLLLDFFLCPFFRFPLATTFL